MSIGAGIFLMTAGAILAFGIRDDSGTVDLNVVGVVIMLAGAAGIWLSYYITNRRRRVETDAIDPVVEEEYRTVQNSITEQHYSDPITGESTIPADRPATPPTERRLDRNPPTERRIDRNPPTVRRLDGNSPTERRPDRNPSTERRPDRNPSTERRIDAESAAVRRIDLDPAASDLHTPTPYRSEPPPAAADAEPLGGSDADRARSESRRRQLRGRLRVPHLPGRRGNR